MRTMFAINRDYKPLMRLHRRALLQSQVLADESGASARGADHVPSEPIVEREGLEAVNRHLNARAEEDGAATVH